MKTCTFESCDRKHYAKGYCQSHYKQLLNKGTVSELRPRALPDENMEDVLAKYSHTTDNGCVIWDGATTGTGYPHLKYNGVWRVPARYRWEQNHGPLGTRRVTQTCENRLCFAEEHLTIKGE